MWFLHHPDGNQIIGEEGFICRLSVTVNHMAREFPFSSFIIDIIKKLITPEDVALALNRQISARSHDSA